MEDSVYDDIIKHSASWLIQILIIMVSAQLISSVPNLLISTTVLLCTIVLLVFLFFFLFHLIPCNVYKHSNKMTYYK